MPKRPRISYRNLNKTALCLLLWSAVILVVSGCADDRELIEQTLLAREQALNSLDIEAYLALLERARRIVPDIAIAGDFIVGFPGETEEDFQATVALARQARYRNCFVFKYSPRPGTTADKRHVDTVSDEVKQRRNVELLAVQEQVSGQLSAAFLGRTVRVLVEGPSKKAHVNATDAEGHPQLVGRTATDYIVVFNGPLSLAGRFAEVRITETSPLTLFGELAG